MRPVMPKITSGRVAGVRVGAVCVAEATYSTARVKNFFTPSKKVCSFG
jgi:hypothetical protein